MEIHPLGAEFFHTDGWKGRHDTALVTLCNFVNAPKNTAAKRTSTVQMTLDCLTT